MKSALLLLSLAATVFLVQCVSQPGPVLGSTCPCGWSPCRSNSDCGAGGCCAQLSPFLPSQCCVHRQHLPLMQSRGICPRQSNNQILRPTKIGMCEPRYPPPKGANVACPYMLPSDDCRVDEDCPLGAGNIPMLCCPTDLKPGCYIGRRCSPPVLV